MTETGNEIQRCSALVHKAMKMRFNAIAARGSFRELSDQRSAMYHAREELERCIVKENDRRHHMPGGHFVVRSDTILDAFERGLDFLNGVLIPDVNARIEVAQAVAQSQGLASEKMQKELHNEIEYMGVRIAL